LFHAKASSFFLRGKNTGAPRHAFLDGDFDVHDLQNPGQVERMDLVESVTEVSEQNRALEEFML